jgi:arylsulfatase A-like enzyme
MANEAIAFIRKNADRPFFLNYWCFSVHSPWGAKPEIIEKYKAKADPTDPQHNPLYAAMVQSLDENVGRLVKTLDDLKLSDNTIIVFFSDNGGVTFADQDGHIVTSNAPLRGGKATIYEGGTREDCIVIWPEVVKPGSRSDEVIQSIDFYPTVLDMLGQRPRLGQRFDGVSIVPALRRTRRLSREAIFCYFPHSIPRTGAVPSAYVRKGDWKLMRLFHQGDGGRHAFELYNLKDDIGETKNLAAQMPRKVKELDRLVERFLKDTRAVLPKPNPKYDPAARKPEVKSP